MKRTLLLLATVISVSVLAFDQDSAGPKDVPEYTGKNALKFPEQYREWVYLSSGLDMSYTPGANPEHHMFDNVFVNPSAYKKFQENGT